MNNDQLQNLLQASIRRALASQTIPRLVNLAGRIEGQTIHLIADFEGPVSEADADAISELAAEVIADFPAGFRIEETCRSSATQGSAGHIIARHNTESPEFWQPNYEAVRRSCADLMRRLPEAPDAVGTLLACCGEWAALASLRPQATADVCAALRFGAQSAAAAFTAVRYDQGSVEALLGEQRVTFPATGPTSTIHTGAWLLGFGMAATCRDRVALEVLSRDDAIFAAERSSTQGDKFWLPLALALASLVKGDEQEWQARAAEARLEMQPSALQIANPHFVATKLPLLDLGERLLQRAQTGWDEAVAAGLTAHRAYWGSEQKRRDWYGFLAWEILALCSLAHDRGITTTVASPYLPLELVRGECAPASASVAYHFPELSARDVGEAHLFMTLRGCAETDRRHQLLTKGDRLLAQYECRQRHGGETLVFEFALPPEEGAAQSAGAVSTSKRASSLIDAGEFLWLADRFARAVPATAQDLSEESRRRASLTLDQALACLEEVLKFIPEGQSAVPESAFWTPRGRAMRAAEPGRFDRARLEAVRAAWQKLAAEFAPAAAQPAGEEAAKASALASLQIIAAQVAPLLQALRGPLQAELIPTLRPRPEDYDKVFAHQIAAAAKTDYEQLWQQEPQVEASPDQTLLRISIAPAGMLADENELSREFPAGYRAIAHLLNPHRVWVRWKYVRPGEHAGMAYDGLVWIDDHWAWFPKPYRVLREQAG